MPFQKFRAVCFALGVALCVSAMPFSAKAQEKNNVPPLPAPLENLVKDGAQLRYLGREHGLDGWIAIQRGQEQYFYVTQDREVFVSGLLFDKSGKMLTMRQVQALQKETGGALDAFAEKADVKPSPFEAAASGQVDKAFKTPSEQLFADIEGSNWIPLGKEGAPVAYAFIDPQCPHCHDFINDLRRDMIPNGLIQLRIVPVGFRDETRAQAAFMLSIPDAQKRFFDYLDGNKDALPVSTNINQQGVERNLAIMQSWKLNVTPLIVYRGQDGKVKIIQGRPQSTQDFIADLKKPQ